MYITACRYLSVELLFETDNDVVVVVVVVVDVDGAPTFFRLGFVYVSIQRNKSKKIQQEKQKKSTHKYSKRVKKGTKIQL